jgi:hypothetical protein
MFAFVFLAVAATAPMTPADGSYTYGISVAGSAAGKTTITLTHTAGGIQLVESGAASYGGTDYAGTATLNLDGALAPARYVAVYSPPGRTIHAALAFNGNSATETGDNGGTTFTLDASTKHFAVLDGILFSGFFILPSQLRAWNAQAFTAVSPMLGHGGAIALDAALKADRPKTVPSGDLPVSVSDPLAFTVWYDPATLVVDELDVPAQALSVVRTRQE